MKQKLGIVATFMHDPDILILDEPTSGLDPLMQNKFIELIAEEKAKGKTIMMSSHIFEEVERICDRVGIIKDGKIVAIEDIATLKSFKKETFIIKTKDAADFKRIQSAGIDIRKTADHTYSIGMSKDYKDLFKVLAGCSIISFKSNHQSLEDLFMKYYGKAAK